MVHVNFIAERKFKINFRDLKSSLNLNNLKQIKFNRFIMVLIASSIVFFMLLFGIVQKIRLDGIVNSTSRAQARVAELRRQLDAGADVAVGAKNKEQAITYYERRTLWAKVLNDLTTHVPSQVWIKSLSGGIKHNKSISISGWAPDQSLVANMIGSIQNVKSFSSAKLVSSVIAGKGNSGVNFVLQCKLK